MTIHHAAGPPDQSDDQMQSATLPDESDPTYPSQLLWAFQLKRQHADHIEKTLAIEERLIAYENELKSLKGTIDRQVQNFKGAQEINAATKKLKDAGKHLKDGIDSINRTIDEHEKTCIDNMEELRSTLKTQHTALEDVQGNIHEMGIDLVSICTRMVQLESAVRGPQTSSFLRKNDKTDALVMARRIDAVEANFRLLEAQRRADSGMIQLLRQQLTQSYPPGHQLNDKQSRPLETPPVPHSSPSRDGSSTILSPLVLKQSRRSESVLIILTSTSNHTPAHALALVTPRETVIPQ